MSSIRFFRTFLAIARLGSFSEAADKVALTQAAVSFQMRALETELGRQLFDRSGRNIQLNAAGRELVPSAMQLLDLYDQILAPNPPGAPLTGSVSLGTIVSCTSSLAKVITHLKQDHPELHVRLFNGKSGELAEKVDSGEIDAAILVESGSRRASHRWTPLFEEALVVLAPVNAPGNTAREVLAANPFLRFDRTQRTGRQIDRVLRRLGVEVNDLLEVNALGTLIELVVQGAGVTLLPMLTGADWASNPAFRVWPLPPDIGPISRGVGMLERRSHARSAITSEICDACVATFRQEAPVADDAVTA